MVKNRKHSGNLTLLGGKVCLDFINTLDWRGRDQSVEYLNSFHDVIRWCAYVNLITDTEKQTLYRRASKDTNSSEEALGYVLEFRELSHRIFLATVQNKPVKSKDLNRINDFLKAAFETMQIMPMKSEYELKAKIDVTSLKSVINPIIWEVVNLIRSEHRFRIKACADATCGWMFFDTSKNKSRQWCDMKSCGNRAKARTFYRKNK